MADRKREKPRHLGRGLESLLGPITAQSEGQSGENTGVYLSNFPSDNQLRSSLAEIDLASISPNPYQVREVWDEKELAELAESIKTNGVIQPIIVRHADGGYQLIAGERRWRAAKLAGLSSIAAIVRPAGDDQLLELALIENIQRADLNPVERAKAYQGYLRTFSLTQAEAAQRLGEDRSVIANYLRLLDLPDQIKQMLADGRLSMGHARAILGVPTDELRRKLANRALAGRLSVREVERLVRRYVSGNGGTTAAVNAKPAHIIDLEKKLRGYLGTRVSIDTRKNGQRGKIVIEFYSLDEFDRIAERMGLAAMEEV